MSMSEELTFNTYFPYDDDNPKNVYADVPYFGLIISYSPSLVGYSGSTLNDSERSLRSTYIFVTDFIMGYVATGDKSAKEIANESQVV